MNVDAVVPDLPHRAPDVVADIFDLASTFERGRFGQVYMGHLLEHIPWDRLPAFWDAVWAVATPGAEVMVVGPCIIRAALTRQPVNILEAILADPRTPGGGLAHAWTPTEALTVEAVRLGGLEGIEVEDVELVAPPEWPNPDRSNWQTAVRAIIPG